MAGHDYAERYPRFGVDPISETFPETSSMTSTEIPSFTSPSPSFYDDVWFHSTWIASVFALALVVLCFIVCCDWYTSNRAEREHDEYRMAWVNYARCMEEGREFNWSFYPRHVIKEVIAREKRAARRAAEYDTMLRRLPLSSPLHPDSDQVYARRMKLAKWLTLLAGQSLSSKLGLSLSDRMAQDVSLEEEVSECVALSNDTLPVPNIVHYIWFGCKRDFLPYHYLSVLSSLSVQNACKVFFHTDCEPPEENELFSHLKEHENFRIVPKEAPTQIFNRPVERLEHKADVARIELLMRYGGIYLDDTQIVTRSMDPLRKLSCTLPYEKKGTLMNGVIVSEPNAPFLKKWFFLGYNDFEDHRWAWNSCRKPYFLWEKYPNLLHVEPKTFLPSWDKWEELFFDNHYPWRENENYAVHIYHKKYRRNHSLEEIVGMNNTLGELARHTATAYNAWPGRSKYLPHFERREDIFPSEIL